MSCKNDKAIVSIYRKTIMALFSHPNLMAHKAVDKENIMGCVRLINSGLGVSRSEFDWALESLARDGLLLRTCRNRTRSGWKEIKYQRKVIEFTTEDSGD